MKLKDIFSENIWRSKNPRKSLLDKMMKSPSGWKKKSSKYQRSLRNKSSDTEIPSDKPYALRWGDELSSKLLDKQKQADELKRKGLSRPAPKPNRISKNDQSFDPTKEPKDWVMDL